MKSPGNEEGATLVEFGIASLVLLSFLFGIIDFGFALYSYSYTAEAAKEAARYASVRGTYNGLGTCTSSELLSDCNVTSAQVQTWVQNLGYPGINPANTQVTVSWPDGDNSQGHNVRVDVVYTFPISVPFWAATQFQMHSTAEMVISN